MPAFMEAVAVGVDGEVFAGVQVEAEEVANGVGVFETVEAAGGDAAGIDGVFAVEFGVGVGDPGGDLLGLRGGWAGGVFWRHFAGGDALGDAFPAVSGAEGFGRGWRQQFRYGEGAGWGFAAVATATVGAEEGLYGVGKRVRPD
jgi:hypothetical protein